MRCNHKNKDEPPKHAYIAWHNWALKKSKRHEQKLCPKCEKYSIWVRLPKDVPDFRGDEWMIEMYKEYKK